MTQDEVLHIPKVVVITGASSGIGEAAARLLAAHGARLVLGGKAPERPGQFYLPAGVWARAGWLNSVSALAA